MVGGKAGARAAEGIIAKAVADLFRVVAKDAGKDAAGDASRALEKDLAKDLEKDLSKDVEKDLTKDLEKDATTRADKRLLDGDPVDLATGEVLLRQVDVHLAGVLPLTLARTHVSSYRAGRWFGSSWASTLDQHLEVSPAGVRYLSDDGMSLFYPRVRGRLATLPQVGPPLALAADPSGGFTLDDVELGRRLHFGGVRTGAAGTDGAIRVLTAVTDRNGDRIELDYAAAGGITGIRHSGGYRLVVDTSGDRITGLSLADAGTLRPLVRFGYDPDGRLTDVLDPAGRPMRFSYDEGGRLTGWSDRNDQWYRYGYDEAGRCVRSWGAGGYLDATFGYDAGQRTTTATDSLGQVTTYQFDTAGRLVREVGPLGAASTRRWDGAGRLAALTDPLGRSTYYGYDDAGNLTRIVRPDGSQADAEYNALRLPVRVVDPSGATWLREYDRRGNLTAVTDPLGATTRYAYDDRGHLAAVTNPLGHTRRIETDAAGLLTAVVHPRGAVIRYARDASGRLGAVTDAGGDVTRFGRTDTGRLAWRSTADGATERWSYDGEGNLVGHVDAAGRYSTTEVGPFDLPVARTGPDGARLGFSYDTELRLVAVTDPRGGVWTYRYDPAGRLVEETDFDGRTVGYRHDAAGQLVERADPAGHRTRYSRDAMGRVVEQQAGAAVTTFEHDLLGRVVRAVGPDGELTFERDAMGRVVAETCNGHTVRSAYDALGRRVRRRTPAGIDSVWEYDADNRPVSLHAADRTVQFGYDAAGHEVARRLGASLLTQQWSAGNRLLAQTLTAGGMDPADQAPGGEPVQLQYRAYHYRDDGYLLGIDDLLSGPRRFELDAAGRVGAVHAAQWTERYAYDAAGNVTAAAGPAPEDDRAAQGDREYTGFVLHRAGAVRFRHDQAGRIVLRQYKPPSAPVRSWRYAWNEASQLIAVVTPDGQRWRYRYDPYGRRIAKQRLAGDGRTVLEQTDFCWDGALLVEQVRRPGDAGGGAGTVTTWDWLPGSLRPVAQIERTPGRDAARTRIDERFYGIVSDALGTPTELVSPDGRLAWQAQATLWGRTSTRSSGVDCPLRFPGQYHDEETGLHYNYARYYDPAVGRYCSSDPAGLLGGPNPTGYAGNPTRYRDPFGLTPDCAVEALEELPEDDLERILYRVERNDAKGRPFGSARHPGPPTIDEFNPRFEDVRAGDLQDVISARKHGLFDDQVESVGQLGNDDLVRFRPEDPISGVRTGDGLSLTGGHHRTAEIIRRAGSGLIHPDQLVRILVHD